MPTHFKGTAEEVLALNTLIKLTRAADSLTTRLARAGTIEDLTFTQFAVMEALLHLGPLCQGEISAKLLKSGGNITLVIDNLEKQGWVRRERDADDRRLVRVALTKDGQTLINRVFPKHLEAILREISVLTPDEQRQLGDLCRKLGKGEADCPSQNCEKEEQT